MQKISAGKYYHWILCLFLILQLQSSSAQNAYKKNDAAVLNESMNRVTDVIVHDIFSPPVSSRIYAYISIAAYEALVPGYKKYHSLSGKVNALQIPVSEKNKMICYPLASVTALFETAKSLTFSEDLMQQHFDTVVMKYFSSLPDGVLNYSEQFGKEIAKQIIAWSATDNYKLTRTYERYTLLKTPGSWEPTAPDYGDATEPYWGLLRPFVLDSAAQCAPPPPVAFSSQSRSQFYEDALTVYEKSTSLTTEEKEIVFFWDDNPAVMKASGHLTYIEKKPTPAGHWMGIAQIAVEKDKAGIMEAARAYVYVSIALADGFISCWKEKYSFNTIRPETYINKYIDESWKPFLQTPPFPEYTSGHSVISHAAATVLTDLFGKNFAYADSVSFYYGIKPRQFTSFLQAASEASISRLYGGIHFNPSLSNGAIEGIAVGEIVIEKLKK